MLEFLKVPAGRYVLGTTQEGVDQCVQTWRSRLVNSDYSENQFRSWVEKEFPQFPVESKEFFLSKTLVSNQDVQEFIHTTGAQKPLSYLEQELINHPCWGVSLEWAQTYAQWLSLKDINASYRLPTEVEWEIAARGPDAREYPYGEKFDAKMANTFESGRDSTSAVDAYAHAPGPFGHLDLAGNVEEWVSSPYYVYPGGHEVKDDLYERLGPTYALLRGGSFMCGGDLSRGARRHGPFPDPRFRYTGFRIIREAKL